MYLDRKLLELATIVSNFDNKLNQINDKLDLILNKENILMATIQDVVTEVAAETTVNDSIVTLLDGIAAQLTAAQASSDPTAIAAVITSLQANSKILTDAITANTPVVVIPAGTSTVPAGTSVTAAPSTGAPTGSVAVVAK
jgi:hypothetical protein